MNDKQLSNISKYYLLKIYKYKPYNQVNLDKFYIAKDQSSLKTVIENWKISITNRL